MRYAIDIDGTICHTPNINGVNDYTKSYPFHDRIMYVNKLYELGYEIVYWTSRGGSTGIDWHEFTKNQLDSWGCKYTELRCDKMPFDALIDDKAWAPIEFFKIKYGLPE